MPLLCILSTGKFIAIASTGGGAKLTLGKNNTVHSNLFSIFSLQQMDFDLELVDFEVGRYQGTTRAATYASDVRVVEGDTKSDVINISMNEPLYHKGFTFYQSSFSEDEFGKPTTSVFSVNRDPGRPWKYLGSILIVAGCIWLFYFNRPRKKGKKA